MASRRFVRCERYGHPSRVLVRQRARTRLLQIAGPAQPGDRTRLITQSPKTETAIKRVSGAIGGRPRGGRRLDPFERSLGVRIAAVFERGLTLRERPAARRESEPDNRKPSAHGPSRYPRAPATLSRGSE